MKKLRVKSYPWMLLSLLILGWYGGFFVGNHSFGHLRSRTENQDLNYTVQSPSSQDAGHLSKISVAEVEEEYGRFHLTCFKKKLDIDVYFHLSFLSDRYTGLLSANDIVRCLAGTSIQASARYLILRVLRI